MILTNILLSAVVLFFAIRLFLAIRESKDEKTRIRLISRKKGEILQLNVKDVPHVLCEALQLDFIETAKLIFARVADGFAKGRLSDIRPLLDEKVSHVFEKEISERVEKKQKVEFSLIGFQNVQVVEDTPLKKVVSFTTEQINLLKDSKNQILEGDPMYVATVTEYWTFTKAKAASWVLSAIESKEGHFA